MPPDGIETLALWRETGEWWQGEKPREVHRYIDAAGIRRETITELVASRPEPEGEAPRIRRTKDEKVATACGKAEEPKFGGKWRDGGRWTRRTETLSTVEPTHHSDEAPAHLNALLTPVTQRIQTGAYRVALHTMSGYAFGRGTMIATEIPAFVAERGYGAVLLADPFSLCGAMEFSEIAKRVGVIPLIGASFEMAEGGEIVLIARNRQGYKSLSRLISACHLEEPRHYPLCTWERMERYAEGLLCLTGGDDGPINLRLMRRDYEGADRDLDRLIGLYGQDNVFIEIERSYLPWQLSVNKCLLDLAERRGVTAVAGGPVLYEKANHFPAHDILVCVESLCLVEEVVGRKPRRDISQTDTKLSPRRSLNSERYLRFMSELEAIYSDRPDLLLNAQRIVERCESTILPGRTNLPLFCENEDSMLRQATFLGATLRFGNLRGPVGIRIERELNRIFTLNFSRHFLVAWDMCLWAERQQIVFSGRGSVVDSLVAYCLGLSRINPVDHNLHFDRFLPAGAQKRPDIDIDFEAARREDVRQYLVQKYGDAHVATVAAIGTYGTRGIVREVGKALGIPEESVSYLSKRLHGSVTPQRLQEALDNRPELRDSGIPRERFHWVFKLAEQLMDLPRNIRSHSSGVIISEEPIMDTVPVMQSGMDGVKIIQWDKRSTKKCFDKFDVLCLRGNDVLGDTQRYVSQEDPDFKVTNLPLDDENVYRAMRSGELIGIPQSASPAMRQAHIRIKTRTFEDAGIVQAAIRPGVGGAVKLNEYIARRGNKPYRLIHEDLNQILEHTLGLVVFQEQIDHLLQKFGGYTSNEAELIREGIYKLRREEYAQKVREEVTKRIVARNYTQAVAEEVYQLVSQFQGYGFAQGHALSFAEVSIRSIYCQQNFPAEYFSAILNAQPAGYYGPATLANEARNRGVRILPPDINKSGLIYTVEDVPSGNEPHILVPNGGIRVSLRQIGAVSENLREAIIAARGDSPYLSIFDFVARVEVARDELETLILCGFFDSLAPNRRQLLWAIPKAVEYGQLVRSMRNALPLFIEYPDLPVGIEDFSDADKAIYERSILGMDVERHLMAFERARVLTKGGITAAEASKLESNKNVFVVGNPIRLRFPPTSSGKRVMFFDLEDETGLLNVTCFDDVYQRDGHKVICNQYITLWGEAQNRDGHIAFLAHRIFPYKACLRDQAGNPAPLPLVTADFLMK